MLSLMQAATILGVSFPITREELKKAYKQKAFIYHPDRGGNPQDFRTLVEAYEAVKAQGIELTWLNNVMMPETTLDGTPLSELGLGLGPTINGKDCDNCKGLGHIPASEMGWKHCNACVGGRVVINRGNIAWRYCFVCNGEGAYRIKAVLNARNLCTICSGTGEIRIWNPVIPKGAILTTRRK